MTFLNVISHHVNVQRFAMRFYNILGVTYSITRNLFDKSKKLKHKSRKSETSENSACSHKKNHVKIKCNMKVERQYSQQNLIKKQPNNFIL